MATSAAYSAAPNNGVATTGTEIRAWVQAVHDALVAVGLVQTADTGQVMISTMTNPAAPNTAAGYEVWRFSDALQATHPLFLKIEYGRAGNTSSPGSPGMWLTVGKSSDGAGVIGSVILARIGLGTVSGTGTADTTARDVYASSGDGSMLALILGVGSTATVLPAFVLDRSRDSTGAPTADGISVGLGAGYYTDVLSTTITGFSRRLRASNYDTGVEVAGSIPVILPGLIGGTALGGGGSLALSAISPIFPWSIYAPGVIPWQSIAGLSWVDDPGGVFTARVSGADRTYRSVPLSAAQCAWGVAITSVIGTANSFSAYVGLAILWE